MKKIDLFDEWYSYYPENEKNSNPIPRPQPIDFVVSYFQGMKNGIFVDIGAYDGVTWSNSLALEKYFDWSGICVEPLEDVYQQLKNVRCAKCINSAVSNFDGSTQFVKVTGYAEMLSGVESSMNKTHLSRISSEIEKFGGEKIVLDVKVECLKTILKREAIEKIDYLSIDVECGELNVLTGINWDTTDIKLISCEVNEYSDKHQVNNFLLEKGYKHLGRICGDEFFAK